MGEQEFFNFVMLSEENTVENFLKCYSSSRACRENMNMRLATENLTDIDSFELEDDEDDTSSTAQAVRQLFRGIGTEIVKD